MYMQFLVLNLSRIEHVELRRDHGYTHTHTHTGGMHRVEISKVSRK